VHTASWRLAVKCCQQGCQQLLSPSAATAGQSQASQLMHACTCTLKGFHAERDTPTHPSTEPIIPHLLLLPSPVLAPQPRLHAAQQVPRAAAPAGIASLQDRALVSLQGRRCEHTTQTFETARQLHADI
jgi:hypothetical protein